MRRPLTGPEVGMVLGVVFLVICGCLGCVLASFIPPQYPPYQTVPAQPATPSPTLHGGANQGSPRGSR